MLNDAEIALIAREVKTRSGAVITRDMAGAVGIRLQPLARREGFSSVFELVGAARNRADGALWGAITESLAQSETRFFRDKALYETLRREVLPAMISARGREPIRLLSAGCATGQEPYSIAMMLEEMRDEGAGAPIDIVGADLSERLLEKARSGLYTQFEIQRGLPIRKLVSSFEKAGELWRINDRLRAAVRFERHNLMLSASALGSFDIILLSHVLGGFDSETRLYVLDHIAAALAPDGVLLLGAGETLPENCTGLTQSGFIVRKVRDAQVAAA